MRFLYGASDEKFVKDDSLKDRQQINPLNTYKFRRHVFVKGTEPFKRDELPIVFKASPDSLLNMASIVVDALPLTSVLFWTNVEVCRWVRQYGYHHYQRTFRENYIDGRKLLLLDAAALSAMNIKNFDDIKHIAYGIRCLFNFELTKFARSISLPPQYYYELYKLFRVKTGQKFDEVRRTDLWRRMQLLREKHKYVSHWELLERWLAREPENEHQEWFGGARRAHLYRCKNPPPTPPPPLVPFVPCACMPPCQCYWPEFATRSPRVLSCLEGRLPDPDFKAKCKGCIPPCTCNWSSKKFIGSSVLTCLKQTFPHKYGPLRYNRYITTSDSALRLSIWDTS